MAARRSSQLTVNLGRICCICLWFCKSHVMLLDRERLRLDSPEPGDLQRRDQAQLAMIPRLSSKSDWRFAPARNEGPDLARSERHPELILLRNVCLFDHFCKGIFLMLSAQGCIKDDPCSQKSQQRWKDIEENHWCERQNGNCLQRILSKTWLTISAGSQDHSLILFFLPVSIPGIVRIVFCLQAWNRKFWRITFKTAAMFSADRCWWCAVKVPALVLKQIGVKRGENACLFSRLVEWWGMV